MFNMSFLELFVIFIVCLVILSPKDWKFLARNAGILLRKFKNFTSSLFEEDINIKKEVSKIKKELLKNEDD